MTTRRGSSYQPSFEPMDPNLNNSQSPPRGAIQGQISQLTKALNVILGQLTNVTQRLDHLEENRSRDPSVQP